jgi:hypothetical protein
MLYRNNIINYGVEKEGVSIKYSPNEWPLEYNETKAWLKVYIRTFVAGARALPSSSRALRAMYKERERQRMWSDPPRARPLQLTSSMLQPHWSILLPLTHALNQFTSIMYYNLHIIWYKVHNN